MWSFFLHNINYNHSNKQSKQGKANTQKDWPACQWQTKYKQRQKKEADEKIKYSKPSVLGCYVPQSLAHPYWEPGERQRVKQNYPRDIEEKVAQGNLKEKKKKKFEKFAPTNAFKCSCLHNNNFQWCWLHSVPSPAPHFFFCLVFHTVSLPGLSCTKQGLGNTSCIVKVKPYKQAMAFGNETSIEGTPPYLPADGEVLKHSFPLQEIESTRNKAGKPSNNQETVLLLVRQENHVRTVHYWVLHP